MSTNDKVNTIKFTKESENFKELIILYESINSKEIKEITINNCKFNNTSGDITKDIKWLWGINQNAINCFTEFFEEINLVKKVNKYYNNNFSILGISFITLNTDEILDKDSEFHFDIISHYDLPYQTNILTVLIPMKYEKGMGGLEYLVDDTIQYYEYNIGEYIVFDSSKIKHRTAPFKIKNKMNRVLISVNLSSDLEWAKAVTKSNTRSQGNFFDKGM